MLREFLALNLLLLDTDAGNSIIDAQGRGSPIVYASQSGIRCPEKTDPHGRWKGPRYPKTPYNLTCDYGYVVMKMKSVSIYCTEEGHWSSDPWCENEDDCSKLKHSCGPGGLCIDKLGYAECLCERGASMKRTDGEQVCYFNGNTKMHCGGENCGAHGVCVKLEQYDNSFDSGASNYKCSCEQGYAARGESLCQPLDCGKRHDPKGVWNGSTTFGGEYTLECNAGTFISGGQKQAVTMTCPVTGHWNVDYKCEDPRQQAEDAEINTFRFWMNAALSLLCVCTAALAAGLTFGLVSLEPIELHIILEMNINDCTTEDEKAELTRQQNDAEKLLKIKEDPHLLLVTLLLLNACANEALPVFLDELMSPLMAVLTSVSFVLLFCEVLPSAVFSGPSRVAIAVACIPIVNLCMFLFYPIAKPISAILDTLLEHEEEDLYSRPQLRAVVQLHTHEANNDDIGAPLKQLESQLFLSVMALGEAQVSESVGFRPISSTRRRSCATSFVAASAEANVYDVLLQAVTMSSEVEGVVLSIEAVVIFSTLDGVDWPIFVPLEHIVGILRVADLLAASPHATMMDMCSKTPPPEVSGSDLVTDALQKLSEADNVRGFAVVLEHDDFLGVFDGEDAMQSLLPGAGCSSEGPSLKLGAVPKSPSSRITNSNALAAAIAASIGQDAPLPSLGSSGDEPSRSSSAATVNRYQKRTLRHNSTTERISNDRVLNRRNSMPSGLTGSVLLSEASSGTK